MCVHVRLKWPTPEPVKYDATSDRRCTRASAYRAFTAPQQSPADLRLAPRKPQPAHRLVTRARVEPQAGGTQAGGGQRGALQDLAVHGFAVARPRGRAVYEWLVRYVQCGKQPPLGRYHQADLCRISPTCAPGGCGRGGWGDYGVMVASPAMMLFWVWQKAMVLLRRREFV